MPNFVDVWSLDGMADRIDLDGAIPYHPKVWGLIASQSLLATQPPEEWEFVHQRHDTSDGPMAVPVNSAIELTLTGKRTARVFYAGETPRVSTVYQHGSSGLWFIAATKNLMVSGGTYYFELTRKEVMAWMTGNGYKPPTLLSPPVSSSENTRNTNNAVPKRLVSPTDKAIQCYRLKFIMGTEKTQEGIAKAVYEDRGHQPKVSRDLKAVEAWIAAGNVLPDLAEVRPSMFIVDPSKLDLGRRQDKGRRG